MNEEFLYEDRKEINEKTLYILDAADAKDSIQIYINKNKEIKKGENFVYAKKAYKALEVEETFIIARELCYKVFVKNETPRDKRYTRKITCPFCEHEEKNSSEANDKEERYKCVNCNSIFSYSRKVFIEYCSQPVQRANVIEI